jgi:hypothetical protein
MFVAGIQATFYSLIVNSGEITILKVLHRTEVKIMALTRSNHLRLLFECASFDYRIVYTRRMKINLRLEEVKVLCGPLLSTSITFKTVGSLTAIPQAQISTALVHALPK